MTVAVPVNVAAVVPSYILLCTAIPEREIDLGVMFETVVVKVFCNE